MLYHLLFPLHESFSFLNVTRYITFRTAASSITRSRSACCSGPG